MEINYQQQQAALVPAPAATGLAAGSLKLPTKEYISIKNTKQPLLVFIPGPFMLESRKL